MVYTPQRGFAQFQYFDQQATALAGMLANASDINLVDSAFVGPVDATVGLTAGIGVMVNPTVRRNRPGLNYDIVMPPGSAATDESFAGIVVRNQFMRTNSNGEACYFFEDMANYARRDRAGARIWVQLAQGVWWPGILDRSRYQKCWPENWRVLCRSHHWHGYAYPRLSEWRHPVCE